ncbi:MAG: hypothetical protein ABI782_13190, partial [Anaerolineaceae bacterium]
MTDSPRYAARCAFLRMTLDSKQMGIVVNLSTAMLFARGRKGDINIRGAFVHMAADAAVSGAVVLGGAAILLTGK